VVAGGEKIIEGGERRRAEIERQLALHGQSVPSGRILKNGALSRPMSGLSRGERR
jgi:ABC-type lipopolysaccharide export system ATPase subunit